MNEFDDLEIVHVKMQNQRLKLIHTVHRFESKHK